jgi:3-methyladenine DNA glycosylase Tag
MNESVWTSWFYRDKRPLLESAIFENLTRCIFQSGLNWEIIARKWPSMKIAFQDFNPHIVAGYGAEDINSLMNDSKIIRNRRKILATIHNAREFERFEAENGGFMSWLAVQDKANNYQGVIRRMGSRFKFVGPTVASVFLYSIGEDVKFEG